MEALPLFLADLVATGGAIALILSWQQLVVRARWIGAARKTGLTARYSWSDVPRLEGEILGGMHVSVTGDIAKPARIVVRGIPKIVRAVPKRVTEGAATGDKRFDNVVLVEEGAFTSALYDRETRRAVEKLIDRGGWVENGELTVSLPVARETASVIAERVTWATDLALRLSRPFDTAAMLAANAADDEAGVREKCLRFLVENFRDSPVTATACRRARRDVMPAVRLVAALGLGTEGSPVLAELVRSEWVQDEIAMKAIAYAAERLPIELARPTLMAAFKHPRGIVRAQGLHSVARMQWWEPMPYLIDHSGTEEPIVKRALAAGLAQFPGTDAEEALLRLLDEDADTRLAAIASLGKIGGIGTVERLLRFTQGVLQDTEQKRVAASAIRAIQSRQLGAGAGQLTVAETDGRVSMAHDAAGDLAIAETSGALALAKKSDEG